MVAGRIHDVGPMNEPEQRELVRLKEQQARLENELRLLSQQLTSFEQRLSQKPVAEAQTTVRPQEPHRPLPPPVPPIIARESLGSIPSAAPQPAPQTTGTPLAKTIAPVSTKAQTPAPGTGTTPVSPLRVQPDPGTVRAPAAVFQEAVPVPPPLTHALQSNVPARSFEMRLGTYWLVRIGIVMVLTGLVFFGNLAYQNYISRLGPAGKISLLYLASALLLGAGWWWQRKVVKESLKNYAQVLFAGGLAALYFTTYAAHYVQPLQIIASPLLDGVLLLLCAGFMIWAAERKKSEVLAVFAVGLAYYTSIITRVGYFTLWSNLVLSSAAVLFLLRNRWAALSFGSLIATYAAYGFWRFFDGTNWHWASPAEGLWSGTAFLMMYWLVFTSAVFLSRDQKLAGQNRASFLTLNNGAFFTLFLLTMLQVQQGGFWKFCLIYGALLVGLAVLAGWRLAEEPLTANAYLTQGLLLVTVGLISKFAGLQLALMLATESVLLLLAGYQRKNVILLTGAYLSAALAVGWGMDGLKDFDTRGLWLGAGLGLLMLVNAFITHRNLEESKTSSKESEAIVLRPQPSYFTVLALAIWVVATWHNTHQDLFPLVVAVEATLLTFSVYLLRVPEVPLLSQGLMLLAQGAWCVNWFDHPGALPWWNPVLLLALSLALSHWWPRQTIVQPKRQTSVLWPVLYAVAINLVIYLWLAPQTAAPMWLWTATLLAIGLTVYGVITRAWFVAACAQLFLAVSVIQFGLQLWQAKPAWQYPLAPITGLALLSLGTVQWFARKADADSAVREPLLQIAQVYRWVSLFLALIWICEYIPARERIWLLSLLGLLIFLLAGLWRSRETLLFSAAFTGTAVALFWLPLIEAPTVYFPNLVAILALLTQRQVARRLPERYPIDPAIHNAVILIGALSLWLFISRWMLEMASGFYLTASWSVLALLLFAVGLTLRERMYRWVGLGILACALGRVIVFDVWKLETIYRVLSFMALGIVLLVLGFIYSKYQEKIREWL